MAKKPILTDLTSNFSAQSVINNNNEAIENAFDNTLSLDGSTPNAMQADLDLNSNNLLNASSLYADSLYLNGSRLVSADIALTWRDSWLTATSYQVNDLVSESGNVYICVETHTSGTFSTDLSANRWDQFLTGVASLSANEVITGDWSFTGTPVFSNIDVNSGSIDNTSIGSSNPSSGVFTSGAFTTVQTGTITVDSDIIHNGDVDTKISFTENDISLQTGGSERLSVDNNGIELIGGLLLNEQADHSYTPSAGKGELWCKNESPSTVVFTDDTGIDWKLKQEGSIGPVATTSGTTVEVLNIPSGVNRVRVVIDRVSGTNAGWGLELSLRAGTYSNIVSSSALEVIHSDGTDFNIVSSEDGLRISDNQTAAAFTSMEIVLSKMPGKNSWITQAWDYNRGNTNVSFSQVGLTLAAELDGIRLEITGGGTFDSGEFSVFFEKGVL